MERPRLRGAIIGCGFFGGIQREAWSRMPDVELVAACDVSLERAQAFAPRAYTSVEEMLARERLDFVDIATRPELHLQQVRLAAEHRVPCICQKPMAPSWAEAVEMVRAAESTGTRLMIHENWRWQPWYRAVGEAIAAGRIGTPIGYCFRTRNRDGLGPEPYPAQPYFRQMPRLLIHETLVHHIDTARFLFGDLECIYAQTRRVNAAIAGEDQAFLVVTHAGGLSGLIDGNRFVDPDVSGPVMGEAVFEGDEGVLRVANSGEVFFGDRIEWRPGAEAGYRGDSVLRTQRHFVDQLRAGGPFESEGRAYLHTFAAVEAAYRSAAGWRAVRIAEILTG